MNLVKASREDVPVLVGFLGELFALEKDFHPEVDRQEAALSAILDNPDHAVIYLVKVGEEIAGTVALHRSISTAEGGWCGRIEDFYIASEFRRRGVGKHAMEALLAIAADKGLKRLTLVADKDNLSALGFYADCGFEEMNLTTFIKKTSDLRPWKLAK
ncbi:MAG: GNAT family N-acetyltransferase [Actinobacteria bacterium]|nr:GNAT family N-acetyltransferase [Actinomycetota bacterium]